MKQHYELLDQDSGKSRRDPDAVANGDAKYEPVYPLDDDPSRYDAGGYLVATPRPSVVKKSNSRKLRGSELAERLEEVGEKKEEAEDEEDYDDVEDYAVLAESQEKEKGDEAEHVEERKEDEKETEEGKEEKREPEGAEESENTEVPEKTYVRLKGGSVITRESKL